MRVVAVSKSRRPRGSARGRAKAAAAPATADGADAAAAAGEGGSGDDAGGGGTSKGGKGGKGRSKRVIYREQWAEIDRWFRDNGVLFRFNEQRGGELEWMICQLDEGLRRVKSSGELGGFRGDRRYYPVDDEDHELRRWRPWGQEAERLFSLRLSGEIYPKSVNDEVVANVDTTTIALTRWLGGAMAGRRRELAVHPFLDWVARLHNAGLHLTEAGRKSANLLGGWLAEFFVVDEVDHPLWPAYLEWACKLLFTLPIKRALEKEPYRCDEMLVLVGDQGVGKSNVLRAFLPRWALREWFNDGLRLDDTVQKKVESTLGRIIVEASEMAGLSRQGLELLKADLSRDFDTTRLSYRADAVSYAREHVAVGTSNRPDLLKEDPSGQRRFAVFGLAPRAEIGGVEGVIMAAAMHARPMWAQAFEEVRRGYEPRLPGELKEIHELVGQRHVQQDEVADSWVDRIASGALGLGMVDEGVTLDAMRAGLGLGTRPQELRLARALRRNGWRRGRRQEGGVQHRVWFPPGVGDVG